MNQKIVKFFSNLGFEVMSIGKPNANGPDIWIHKNGKPFSVELKKCKITKRGSVEVPPVEKNRRADDFILILHPSGYFFFERMADHMKCCSPKGYREGFTAALDLMWPAVEALERYANSNALQVKPKKAHLYKKTYPQDSVEWRQRSMSDYDDRITAREALRKIGGQQ